MEQSKLSGRDQVLRTSTLIQDHPDRGGEQGNLRGASDGSSSTPRQDSSWYDGEATNDFLSISGDFIYRHHVERRVKLYSPREESFPFPLKYIDVSRTTHTNLDVKQEKRIDDYCNIDASRGLSASWTGFTQFTLFRERLTRKQLTSRPDHLWPELWKSMGKHAKLKEKQKWSNEKIHLENARKLRGIYFIDPEDTEFKETIKNARKKLETSVAPAMPCKIMKKNCGSNGSNKAKTRLACILEADESTRLRMGNSVPNHLEDHIVGKGDDSLQHYNLIHKYILIPQATKIPAAKAAVDKEWENWRKFRRGTWQKSEVRKRWSMKQGTTHKSLDVLLEKNIEDNWNVDGERELSDARTGFTRFIFEIKTHQMDIHGPGADWQENKRPPGQTMYGQICGNICLRHRNAKRSTSGQSRNQSSKMPGDCVVFSFSILMMKSSSVQWKMLVESWKFRCQQQRMVDFNIRKNRETCCTVGQHKTKYACIDEADESKRISMEGSQKTRTMKTSSQE